MIIPVYYLNLRIFYQSWGSSGRIISVNYVFRSVIIYVDSIVMLNIKAD